MSTKLRTLSAMAVALLSASALDAQTLPIPSHIVILIEENQANSLVIGSSVASIAPYMNALAADTNAAVFSNFYAIEHPSQPNYMDFFSGQNQGTTGTDNILTTTPLATPNLGAQLISAGKTFTTYSEDLPSSTYLGSFYNGDDYARKHNPSSNWIYTGSGSIPANQLSPSVSQPWTAFPASSSYGTLPTVTIVVPNETDDMHDGTYPSMVTAGDTWFHDNLASLLPWTLDNNTLFIITFDEDDDAHNNNIPTIFYGPMVKGGLYSQNVSLYSLLRTIEQMYGCTPYLGAAADSNAITFCWRQASPSAVKGITKGDLSFKVMPNPASEQVTFTCVNNQNLMLDVTVVDEMGRIVNTYNMNSNTLQVNTSAYASGTYVYKVENNHAEICNGKFVISHN